MFILTNHYICLFRTCRINAGCKTSPILLFLRGNGGWVPMGLLGPQNCSPTHTTVISGHRWLQMAGSPWILVGSGWDTSRMVCWCHLDPRKLSLGGPRGSEIAQKCHKTVITGHRWLHMAGSPWITGATYGQIWISTQPDRTDEMKSLGSPIKQVAKH